MRHLLILFFCLFLFSCSNLDVSKCPGICLSFDDGSVDEWFELRKFFNDNNVKVTFFITQPDSLSNDEIDKLKLLENDGHEIGFHGNMHVISERYIKENSYAAYLDYEIDRGMEKMSSLGFHCSSFAYPYGAKYWFTDFLLARRFEFIRDVSPLNQEKDLTLIDEIYYSFDEDNTVSAIGIDVISGVDEKMIEHALERALENKEVLLIYGHKPLEVNLDNISGYEFNLDLLIRIIQKVQELNIKFYRIKDLNKGV